MSVNKADMKPVSGAFALALAGRYQKAADLHDMKAGVPVSGYDALWLEGDSMRRSHKRNNTAGAANACR